MVAEDTILDRTLLCEYVGEVDFLCNHEHSDHDSLFDLLNTGDSKTSLVINPERYGNVARFMSGINNSKADAHKVQNVRSIRFVLDGEFRVFLFADRNIRKGERLTYDYNGHGVLYPTSHFT